MATGYVRSTDTWGVNSIPFDKYQKAGIDQLVFAANDPHLSEALKNAAAHGVKAGIWIPAGNEGDPVKYAQNIKALQNKYGNVPIIPNIEETGKGYAGSKGWQWSQTMMAELKKLGVPPNMSVAVMGNQDDFNYKAYTANGVKITAEAFGAKTSETYDPQKIRQRLIDNGVPANMIDVMLAPNHGGKGGNSVFTVDDLKPEQLQPGMFSGQSGQVDPGFQQSNHQQEDGPLVYEGGPGRKDTVHPLARPVNDGYSQVHPENAGFTQQTDANNPRAVAYARQRLAQLQKQGYSPADFGITGDPTAQWRAMSSLMGAQQAISSGHAADYHVGPGTPPAVSDVVNNLIFAATGGKPADAGFVPPVYDAVPDMTAVNEQQQAIIAAVNPNSQVLRTHAPGPMERPTLPGTRIASSGPMNHPALPPPRPSAPLQPHQMGPLTPGVKRVGPMQQAIQVAAAMRHLRQLRPAPARRSVGRE